MADIKHRLRYWRGKRASYDLIVITGGVDPWTRYSVLEPNGTYSEYFGTNLVNNPTGQLLPVNDVVSGMPETASPGDRFLLGTDETGYKIIEYYPLESGELVMSTQEFDYRMGIRIKSKAMKNYVYYNGKLISYDDVDCGEF